jgi:hypothetical protein
VCSIVGGISHTEWSELGHESLKIASSISPLTNFAADTESCNVTEEESTSLSVKARNFFHEFVT